MGVYSLLKLFYQQDRLYHAKLKRNLNQFREQEAGIDMPQLILQHLHKNKNSETKKVDKHTTIIQIKQKLQTLVKKFNIKIKCVFDGRNLQIKSKKKPQSIYKSPSYDEIKAQIINYLYIQNIQYTIAPYEADHQLVHMFRNGQIKFVISEDSDFLIHGVPLFSNFIKLQRYKPNGNGRYYNLNQIRQDQSTEISNQIKMFVNLSQQDKILVAGLFGCDYIRKIMDYQSMHQGPFEQYINNNANYTRKIYQSIQYKAIQYVHQGAFEQYINNNANYILHTFSHRDDIYKEFQQGKNAYRHALIYDKSLNRLKPLEQSTKEISSFEIGQVYNYTYFHRLGIVPIQTNIQILDFPQQQKINDYIEEFQNKNNSSQIQIIKQCLQYFNNMIAQTEQKKINQLTFSKQIQNKINKIKKQQIRQTVTKNYTKIKQSIKFYQQFEQLEKYKQQYQSQKKQYKQQFNKHNNLNIQIFKKQQEQYQKKYNKIKLNKKKIITKIRLAKKLRKCLQKDRSDQQYSSYQVQ